MKVRKSYRRISVKDVCVEELLDRGLLSGECGTTVGLDIAKKELVVVIRWGDGTFERPWSVGNPDEIELLVVLLRRVALPVAIQRDQGNLPGGVVVQDRLIVKRQSNHRKAKIIDRGFGEFLDKAAQFIAEITDPAAAKAGKGV